MFDIDNIVRDNVLRLSPYSTARDESSVLNGDFLDANENPFDRGYNRYPDPHHKLLRESVAQRFSISQDYVFTGNGSDEVIDLLFRAFCNPGVDNVVSIAPTYGMYKVASGVNDVEFREVLLEDDFSINIDRIISRIDKKTKLLFLCNPNNPTGNVFDNEVIDKIALSFNGLLVIDEAYMDFTKRRSYSSRVVNGVKNVVIVKTLSKAFGLASLRVGIAIANPSIIGYLDKVKYPYNLNAYSQLKAVEALSGDIDEQLNEIGLSRGILECALVRLSIVERVFKSETNFILVKFKDAKMVYNYLLDNDIVVRDRSSLPLCESSLRITVGTREQSQRLIKVLEKISS